MSFVLQIWSWRTILCLGRAKLSWPKYPQRLLVQEFRFRQTGLCWSHSRKRDVWKRPRWGGNTISKLHFQFSIHSTVILLFLFFTVQILTTCQPTSVTFLKSLRPLHCSRITRKLQIEFKFLVSLEVERWYLYSYHCPEAMALNRPPENFTCTWEGTWSPDPISYVNSACECRFIISLLLTRPHDTIKSLIWQTLIALGHQLTLTCPTKHGHIITTRSQLHLWVCNIT